MIYTVTLNPAIDYVVRLESGLKLGGINRSRAEDIQFGGKGINVSNVLKTLGVDTVALGFVAGFTGRGLEEGLAGMGLPTDFIHLDQGLTRINTKVKADVETEVSPIIGNEEQSREFIDHLISDYEEEPEKIWDLNIFGRTLSSMVSDGMQNKIYRMPEDAQMKLQETLQKIVNEGSGGLICIIL